MIKLLILDVDGTLTDGSVYISENGEVFKKFNIKDGLGITLILPKIGIDPIVITGRESEATAVRCEEIGISDIYQGVANKSDTLKIICDEKNISLKDVAYIGDDINDFDCMVEIKKAGGIVACPKDAIRDVRHISDYVSTKTGGKGAVRDFIEYLANIKARG